MSNKVIKIKWLSDTSDCEACGGSWAEGARVTMPDGSIIDMTPHATCMSITHYDMHDVYRAILARLGYSEVEEIDEDE